MTATNLYVGLSAKMALASPPMCVPAVLAGPDPTVKLQSVLLLAKQVKVSVWLQMFANVIMDGKVINAPHPSRSLPVFMDVLSLQILASVILDGVVAYAIIPFVRVIHYPVQTVVMVHAFLHLLANVILDGN